MGRIILVTVTLFVLLVGHGITTSCSYPTTQEVNLKFQAPVNKKNLIRQLIDQVSPQDSSTVVYFWQLVYSFFFNFQQVCLVLGSTMYEG